MCYGILKVIEVSFKYQFSGNNFSDYYRIVSVVTLKQILITIKTSLN